MTMRPQRKRVETCLRTALARISERQRDGSKRGGGSANGRRRRALPQGDRATVKARHWPQTARTRFSALSRRKAEYCGAQQHPYFILSTALVHIRSVTLWTKAQQQQYSRTYSRRSQNERLSYLSDAGETGLLEKTLGKLSYQFPLVKD